MAMTGRFLKEAMLGLVLGIVSITSSAVDLMQGAALKDVKLGGDNAVKMNAFFQERMLSEFAQREIFGEARRAFETRDDDILGFGGRWRGEFWGKLMLSIARVAEYLGNPELTQFVDAECHRLMALQDEDGYLGSYSNKELVAITDLKATYAVYGWGCCWNIWNRKYAMWGMLMAYQATGDKAILESVEHQMDQLIAMMKRLGLKLKDTGAYEMNGMPSMSLLKPLLQLYRVTNKPEYLAFAKEIVADWDRDDGACPNFLRNAYNGKILSDWYEKPWDWAKAYEMQSCLDGLVEYYRVTGNRGILNAVIAIRDNIAVSEANPFGGVGFGDKFIHAAIRPNALSEVCDAIHWIRLNLDLYEVTGEKRFLDTIETAYYNNFLPGVYRKGDYGCFFLRGAGRHEHQYQCGFAYNHCCVNNMARTFMDMAEGAVTVDTNDVYHVNFYQDAIVNLKGVTLSITGNYPKGNVVTVRAKASKVPRIEFRQPAWCPKLEIEKTADDTWLLTFDMNPRVINRTMPADDTPAYEKGAKVSGPSAGVWMRRRYVNGVFQTGDDLLKRYRSTPAAEVMYGPLVLAKAKRVGDTTAEIFPDFTVNNKGYSVSLEPVETSRTWCAWNATLTKPGQPTIKVKVCDFQSAGDEPLSHEADAFSIWF